MKMIIQQLKEKIHNLFLGHQKNDCPEELGYRDLTPEADTKNSQEYIKALHWAIENKEVKNIALSGPYGSGKSSVIKTYLEKYPKTKYLPISLAAFSTPAKKQNGIGDNPNPLSDDWTLDDVDENIIEEGILKQLFYKVDVRKIPQSRYRKIKKLSYWKMFLVLLGLIATVVIVSLEVRPGLWKDFNKTVIDNGEDFSLNGILSYVVLFVTSVGLILLATLALKYIMSNFRVAHINLGDKASLSSEEKQESIFDKSLDEIVYFFESTQYDTVFIEDLDRFNQPNIFIKLRELNTVINNYDNIKRKVVFVYAIKDDMFKDEDRTKFFDFIIPVIPYINATNSGEILRDLLEFEKDENGIYKSKKYDITDRYIGEISPFIQDMRVLTNICNEFLVYKRTLKMTKLKDHEMFSMIAFKNLYPKEFAELEAEKGIVKQIFKGKREFVVGKKTGIEEKIAPKKEILENVHNDILWGMRDIKHAFLGYLSDENGTRYPVSELEINNRSYTYEQIIQDSFDISNFDNINQLHIGYRTSNNYNTQWSSFNNIKQKMDNGGKKYLSRMLDIRYAENSKKQQLIAEINGLERQVVEIEGYSLREIIDNFGESFLPEQLEKYEFLKFLLIKGYINESYADYINYFHPNSITKDENDYLRSIRMRNGVKNYGFEIKNLQQVSDRIYDTEYRHPETLNYLLTDFMLTTCTNQENKRYYFDGFEMDKSNTHYQFAKEYIERGQNVGLFVSELCKYYIHIWKCVLEDVTLSDEVKYKYLELIFNNATMPQIEKINEADNSNCIKNFIVEDENSLAMLNGVSSDVMIEFISEQSVVFCKVNNTGADKQVLEFIYKNNMYELNRDMIASVIGFYHPELEEELSKSHYTTLIKANNDVLNTRIWGSFEEYVNLFVLGIAENTAEDIETVEDIIERLANINVDLVFEVLDKEQVSWADFNECCTNDVEKDIKKKIWNYLLQNQRIYATWNNFDAYYTEFGLTSELSTWVNKICNDIVHTEITGNINDDCIKKIITNSEILLQTVEQIADNYECKAEIEFDLSKLSEEKINLLIEKQFIRYSVSITQKIKSQAIGSFTVYCEQYIDDFMNDLASVSLNENEIILLLDDIKIDNKFKPEILKKISASSMTEKLAKVIADNKFKAEKTYVTNAWNKLLDVDKQMLLINHLLTYDISEIPNLLKTIGKEWSRLSDNKSRHKEEISIDSVGNNKKLLAELQNKGYITSYTEKKDKVHTFFEVWVKQR